jgi:hypothetical protein
MLIFRGGSWPEHRPWYFATLIVTLAATVWYTVTSVRAGYWLGGGSLPGLTFGIVGGLIVIFEMLLWVRKKYRAVRIGRAKLWMKAHIWLGLLCLPLIVLHSGFRWWGGSLSSVLMFAFLGVIVSGIWGLVLQQYLPRIMYENVPAETIRSQIGHILEGLLEESERVVRMTCGEDEPQTAAVAQGADQKKSFLVIGAVRESGSVQGKFLQTGQVRRVPNSDFLMIFFRETVAPYLRAKSGRGTRLASAKRAGILFQNARTQLDPAAYGALGLLEDACNQRRQFDLQARLHAWLHAWLCVHLPLSLAMFLLMIAHIYYALRYY